MKAYQKIIREQKAKEKPLLLFPDKPDSIDLKEVIVKPINYHTAEKIIKEYEWLGTMPTYSTHYFGIYFDGACGGVVVFGISLPKSVMDSICGEEYGDKVRVLSRGACVHWTPIGTASKLISKSIKSLKNEGYKIIVAYSDERAGEIGTIYQSCNFYYTGKSTGGKEYLINGRWRTGKGASHYAHQKRNLNDYESRKRGVKYRYIYLIGTHKEKKEMLKKLKYDIKEYPKRIAVQDSRENRSDTIGESLGQYQSTAQKRKDLQNGISI